MKGIASMYSACRDIFRSRVRNARVRIFFFSDKVDGKGENITSCVKIDRTFEQARLLLSNDERGYERRTCTWKSMTPTIQIRGCKTTSICQYDSLSLFLDTRRRGLDRNSCHSNRYFAVSFRIYSLSLSLQLSIQLLRREGIIRVTTHAVVCQPVPVQKAKCLLTAYSPWPVNGVS